MGRKDIVTHILISAVVAALTVLIIFAGLVLGGQAYPGLSMPWNREKSGMESAGHYALENLVVGAVETADPAVVAITISKNIPVYERYFRSVPGPFGELFGFAVPEYRQRGVQKQEVGGGSGFLVSGDGYIVTNRHVVDDEDAEYTVFMNDGSKHEAEVVARDVELDIALVKIDGSGFPHLLFGDSDDLKVGQSVISIGNALAEFRNTVSLGIVSGLSRSIVASDAEGNRESLEQLIQTDAAINQGNSGGPLLDLNGKVIGVNVAVAAEAENIGFAISGNSVKEFFESVASGQ